MISAQLFLHSPQVDDESCHVCQSRRYTFIFWVINVTLISYDNDSDLSKYDKISGRDWVVTSVKIFCS